MISGFSKYILIAVLCAVIVIAMIIFIVCMKRKKRPVITDTGEKTIDDNKTLDLEDCSQTAMGNMPDLADGIFEIEYDLTFIHTDEIIM